MPHSERSMQPLGASSLLNTWSLWFWPPQRTTIMGTNQAHLGGRWVGRARHPTRLIKMADSEDKQTVERQTNPFPFGLSVQRVYYRSTRMTTYVRSWMQWRFTRQVTQWCVECFPCRLKGKHWLCTVLFPLTQWTVSPQ